MHVEPRAAPDVANGGERVLLRLVGFTRTLRDNGFAVGLKETEDAARVMCSHVASTPAILRSALKSLFCARRSDWLKFDDLFDAYWLGRGMGRVVQLRADPWPAENSELRGLVGSDSEPGQETGLGDHAAPGSRFAEQDYGSHGRAEGASRAETLATDFRKIVDWHAMAEAHALAGRLARRMRTRLSRRQRAHFKGRRIDLRRTIRRNVSHGGVPIELLLRQKKPKPLRVVILLDASGSMSLYTSVFVRFIHGVLDHFSEAEAFLFHTRLVHISAAMREKDVGRALERLSLLAQGVGGGTRIGESLATFNRWYAASVIRSRTCVIIISDGYDTGPPEALAAELERVAKRCRRVVWLNPMIGWDGYAPETRGMRAALPHIDLFAPAHNLKSLAALEPYLARL
jgi:uncharacterized protein with von Willebrand factor type A (vWA) domain